MHSQHNASIVSVYLYIMCDNQHDSPFDVFLERSERS